MSGLGGRLLVAGGIGLMAVGAGGAFVTTPPGQLEDVARWLEDRRAALRSHLPDMPEMQDVILGSDGAGADSAEGNDGFSNRPVRMLRGGGGRTVLAPPAPAEPCAGPEGEDAASGDCAASAEAAEPSTGPTLLNRSRTTSTRFRAPGG